MIMMVLNKSKLKNHNTNFSSVISIIRRGNGIKVI